MLDYIRSLFKTDLQMSSISIITGHIHDIVELSNDEYMKDKKSKNALIDAAIKLLNDHKIP